MPVEDPGGELGTPAPATQHLPERGQDSAKNKQGGEVEVLAQAEEEADSRHTDPRDHGSSEAGHGRRY